MAVNIISNNKIKGNLLFPKNGKISIKISKNWDIKIATLVISPKSNISVNGRGLTINNESEVKLTADIDNTLAIKLIGDYGYLDLPIELFNSFSGGSKNTEAIVDYTKNFNFLTFYSHMFRNAPSFNQDISKWDGSNVTDTTYMFTDASSFNQDISKWDVSNVITINGMFSRAYSFNQDISNWNLSKVINTGGVFNEAPSFNQDISNWDISQSITLDYILNDCKAFDQDLSKWFAKMQINVNLFNFMGGVTKLSTNNYDNMLNAFWLDYNTTRKDAWAGRTEANIISFGLSKYSSKSATARAGLIDAGWVITDGGLNS